MMVRPYATAEILSPPIHQSPLRRPICLAPPLAPLAPLYSPACRCSRPSRDPVVIFVSADDVAGNKSGKKGRNSGEEWERRGEILRKLHTRFALCAMAPRLPLDVAPVSSWWRGCVLAVESLESLATWSVMSVRRRSGMMYQRYGDKG